MNAPTDNSDQRIVQPWCLSWHDWLAYERDMDNRDDYERWMIEVEAEASDAWKLPADLKTSNTPC